MKAIFDTRPDTQYKDDIVCRYEVPKKDLEAVRKAVGDWIIYRGTRRGKEKERNGYFAVAQISHIDTDTLDRGLSFAHLKNYLEFDDCVQLSREGRYCEENLDKLAATGKASQIGSTLRGNSIRGISDREFESITQAGFAINLGLENAHGLGNDPEPGNWDNIAPEAENRRIEQVLVNRAFRDAAFRTAVVSAYDETCAVSRLKIINGGGRAEVEAAHIWPVADGGPDVVQNGLALSATCHWLFDRHLISLSDDYGLLVSHNRVPAELRRLFEPQRERIHLPADSRHWPNREYMARHRERFAGHQL